MFSSIAQASAPVAENPTIVGALLFMASLCVGAVVFALRRMTVAMLEDREKAVQTQVELNEHTKELAANTQRLIEMLAQSIDSHMMLRQEAAEKHLKLLAVTESMVTEIKQIATKLEAHDSRFQEDRVRLREIHDVLRELRKDTGA